MAAARFCTKGCLLQVPTLSIANTRLWLVEQSAYGLWQAQERFKAEPMRVLPAPAAA